MIIEFKNIDLFGHPLISYGVAKPPYTLTNSMANEACFAYVLEGENHVFSDEEKVIVSQNEAVLMKCGNYIMRLFSSNDKDVFKAITIHFHPEVLKKAYGDSLPEFLKNQIPATEDNIAQIKNSGLIRKYIESVLFYVENDELASEEILVLKLKELVLLLLQTDNAAQVRKIMDNLFRPRKKKFEDVIDSHIFSSLSSIELAQLTNNSLSSFKREFKRIYQDSPSNYIQNKKLKKAAEMLLVSEDSISNIAYDCGFSSLAHFSKAFKAGYHTSPSEYRVTPLSK